MDRKDVYNLIDGERDYQDAAAANSERPDVIPVLSVGEALLAMEQCLMAARTLWYRGSGNHAEAMDQVRRIAALSVAAMENHGAPAR